MVLTVLLVVAHGGGTLEQWGRFGTLTQSFFADTVVNDVDGPMWSLLPVLARPESHKSSRSGAIPIPASGACWR